jgi:hypothetical protein
MSSVGLFSTFDRDSPCSAFDFLWIIFDFCIPDLADSTHILLDFEKTRRASGILISLAEV